MVFRCGRVMANDGYQLPLPPEAAGIQPSATVTNSDFIKVINNNNGAYDLEELDQAFFLYLEGQHASQLVGEERQVLGIRPPTLNIFPSQPMHADSPQKAANGESEPLALSFQYRNLQSRGSTQLGFDSPSTSSVITKRSSEQQQKINTMELPNPRTDPIASRDQLTEKDVKKERNRKGPISSSEHEGPKTPDAKTLRRLAQNREAARKSRLRKKAYVQQLESSRIRLTQLEQELQKARAQGVFFGGALLGDQGIPNGNGNLSADAALFNMEYARWLEDHHRMLCDLRVAVQEHLPETDLRLYIDNFVTHYDELMNLKGMIVKSDAFHVLSGMWKTPAERCFMWIGGFRPSELLKMLVPHIEPLTEQQFLGICSLQQSSHQAEEALSQGLDSLYVSLSESVASGSLSCPSNYMGQMAIAMNKISNVQEFIMQADSLRQQTLQQLHSLLTVRQAARCFLAVGEYFHRLRALSSLWLARPKQD